MVDILIFSTSLQEHINTTKIFFEVLRNIKLKIKVDKYEFLIKVIQFLDPVLSAQEIKPNPDNASIIQNLKIPPRSKFGWKNLDNTHKAGNSIWKATINHLSGS